jgi:hypothetical protein
MSFLYTDWVLPWWIEERHWGWHPAAHQWRQTQWRPSYVMETTYCSSYFHAVETTMTWYVMFRGRKPRVYESWWVCSEYIVCFSCATFQSYLTRMHVEKAYEAFLKHIVENGEPISNKWCWKDWVILGQFIVIDDLWYKIMWLVYLWL